MYVTHRMLAIMSIVWTTGSSRKRIEYYYIVMYEPTKHMPSRVLSILKSSWFQSGLNCLGMRTTIATYVIIDLTLDRHLSKQE